MNIAPKSSVPTVTPGPLQVTEISETQKSYPPGGPEAKYTNLRHCPRCGQDHERIQIMPLRNVKPDSQWRAWMFCPVTMEPVLA